MSGERTRTPSGVDRSGHLAALHEGWETPFSVVQAVIAEVTDASIVDSHRIVAGEQNEVYDVTLQRAGSLIVRISHAGHDSHDREAWVIGQCTARGIHAPRLFAHRGVDVGRERRSVLVMEKLAGERLSDAHLTERELRRVLIDLGAWLRELHSIPVSGFGYLDGSGVGFHSTMADWLANVEDEAGVFEEAGRSVGLEVQAVRGWVREIFDSFEAAPPRVTLLHNDLLANHVLVEDGQLSGVIDFGEVAAEPAVSEFAKWSFHEGDRFPVEWIQEGYGDPTLVQPPNDLTYRALWRATGLWQMAWYHKTGFQPGVEAARDRLLGGP